MGDNRAFTAEINPVGSGGGEEGNIHQCSPAWVLTFVRWQNRNPFDNSSVDARDVRDPLVVENDCVQVTVSVSKGNLTPSMNAVLVMTDVNYETAVAPGDFVFVNMLNWPADARRVVNQANARHSINGPNDGFKGLFKIQGVRRVVSTDPNTGTRMVLFKINAFGFTEFNNTIYFNNYLVDQNQDSRNQLLFASRIGTDWANIVNKKGLTNIQDMIAVLIQSFIGAGISTGGLRSLLVGTPNVHFYMPELVGSLLGVQGVKAAKDIFIYLFGIQQYASGSAQSLSDGMNPDGCDEKYDRFFFTPTPCEGDTWLKPEYWNQVKCWSILNQYTNAPLNEMYTCFRVAPDSNKIMPTVVLRQIPFTNDDYGGPGTTTLFTNLPRWKVHPALILEQDIGRDEAARINFVQYFGTSGVSKDGADQASEIARGNISFDEDDVQRSGLRPYIVTSQFDIKTDNYTDFRSPTWAQVLADCIIGGHLKLNGTITCAGIVDAIAVGDNLEFDDVIYHIEQISHTCSVAPQDGRITFRTSISLSNGIHIDSNANAVAYAEMRFPRASEARLDDAGGNEILPGVSESQDIVGRTNPDIVSSTVSNVPFVGGQRGSRKE